MPNQSASAFELEWICLQNQYDSYEKCSLIIKLVSVIVCTALLFHEALDFIVVLLCSVLWLIDSVWKTFQSRISARLLEIENAIVNDTANGAFQFNSQWSKNRPSSTKLLREYLANGLSPTVLGPHVLIIAISVLVTIIL